MIRITSLCIAALFAAFPLTVSSATMIRVTGLGVNLVRNGGAESGPASANATAPVAVPYWSRVGRLPLENVVRYGYDGYPALNAPGPSARGHNLFFGGIYPLAGAMQTIGLQHFAQVIDTGKIRYAFSVYLGGWESQPDYAQAQLKFLPSGATHQLGPVTNLQRKSNTGLWLRLVMGYIPKGTRSAQITLLSTRFVGTSNDGYIDNVSLILSR